LRFKVGTELEPAVVRIHHKLRENMAEKPAGVEFPMVRSYTIDDVPFLALTFHSAEADDYTLRQTAQEFAKHLSEIPDVSLIKTLGGLPDRSGSISTQKKMEQHHVSMMELFEPLKSSNVQAMGGTTKTTDNGKGHRC
jgi:multidrug efflux pump subunit AcrB